MCNTKQALAILSEVYHACNRAFDKKICDAYLYGSYARGDYSEESDIDILLTVDVEPEELPLYRRTVCRVCSDLGLKYDILVSPAIEPLQQFKQFQSALPFYQNILREGIRYTE